MTNFDYFCIVFRMRHSILLTILPNYHQRKDKEQNPIIVKSRLWRRLPRR